MSFRERTLILKIDDTQLKDAIKKMQNINNGGTFSTSKPKGMEGLAKIFTQNSGILKVVAQLALILAAITAMVTLISKITDKVINSSPILQTMLKLFQTSITFILRPIGDFIAFFLRPFLIYFLRSVALPMYQILSPVMRNLGTFLGNNLFSNIMLQYNPKIDPFFGPDGAFSNIGKKIQIFKEGLSKIELPNFNRLIVMVDAVVRKLVDFVTTLPKRIGQLIPIFTDLFKSLVNFADSLVPLLPLIFPVIEAVTKGFVNLFNNFSGGLGLVTSAWKNLEGNISGLWNIINTSISVATSGLESMYLVITEFFAAISRLFPVLTDAIDTAIRRLTDPLGELYNFFTSGGSNGGNTSTTNYFYGSSTQQEYTDVFSFDKIVSKSMNSVMSGGR